MSALTIVSLAAQKLEWLAQRQNLLAQNIANANTPAYHSKDLLAFDRALFETAPAMSSTNPRHLTAGEGAGAVSFASAELAGEQTHSGNSVVLEQEMMKLGTTHSDYVFATSIIKSFNRIYQLSLKG